MLALVLIFAAYVLVDGDLRDRRGGASSARRRALGHAGVRGAISIVTGIVAVLWPGLTVIAFVLLVAAWAIVTGSLMLAAAFRLRHRRRPLVARPRRRGLRCLFGALLIVAPMIGALVLTWWLGAWALVFGVLLLVLAYKLRSRHIDRSPTAAARAA